MQGDISPFMPCALFIQASLGYLSCQGSTCSRALQFHRKRQTQKFSCYLKWNRYCLWLCGTIKKCTPIMNPGCIGGWPFNLGRWGGGGEGGGEKLCLIVGKWTINRETNMQTFFFLQAPVQLPFSTQEALVWSRTAFKMLLPVCALWVIIEYLVLKSRM